MDENFNLDMQSGDGYAEMISYMVWGAVVSTSKSFGKTVVKIDPGTNRIFISIELRWWAKFKRLRAFRNYWLRKAEKNAKELIPKGWNILVYYAKGETHGSNNRCITKRIERGKSQF